ncbi:hypothetical protein [Flaviaesturariibacter amylovorans]|uniref:Uncharacterized protein n=1 Tax=Flaviaesturariibacter amylovorans TaxID=1084520 RepID=A0ABP8GV56_9BACT
MEKRDQLSRESVGQEPAGQLPSETVHNAHAAGDGALERSGTENEDPAARTEDPRSGEPDDTTRY